MFTTTDDQQALLAAIHADLADDGPRLAYADFLMENGQEERGEFVSVQCQLARLDNEATDCFGRRDPAWQRPQREALRLRAETLLSANAWTASQLPWLSPWYRLCSHQNPNPENPLPRAVFHRGFIREVHCDCAPWLAHDKAIAAAAPTLETVRLTDREPVCRDYDAYWHCLSFGNRLTLSPPDVDTPSLLPRVLFDLLPADQLEIRRAKAISSAHVRPADPKRMHDWLSAACLLFARA